jgi:hypothetical protein
MRSARKVTLPAQFVIVPLIELPVVGSAPEPKPAVPGGLSRLCPGPEPAVPGGLSRLCPGPEPAVPGGLSRLCPGPEPAVPGGLSRRRRPGRGRCGNEMEPFDNPLINVHLWD